MVLLSSYIHTGFLRVVVDGGGDKEKKSGKANELSPGDGSPCCRVIVVLPPHVQHVVRCNVWGDDVLRRVLVLWN